MTIQQSAPKSLFLPSLSEIHDDTVTLLGETVGERKVFYRLGDSELFTYANKNTSINNQKLIDVIPRMVMSDQGFMQIAYTDLDKTVQYELFEGPRYKLSCKRALKEMVENGVIVMVYSEEYKIPTCIPYVIQGSGRNARIFVNVSDFLVLDQYGKYQVIQARNYNAIMAAIFAAAVSVKIVQSNTMVPSDLGDGMILVYAAMLERAINSLVHMDPITKDKVRYLAAEFALIQMYGTTAGQDMFFRRFKNTYFPKLSKMITESLDSQFQIDSFDRMSSFILELKRLYPSMRGLNDYMVYDKWFKLYGTSTSMSIDYFGYHIYTICMVLFESPLISRMALEPVMEKNKGTEMYRRMQMMIGNQ